MADPHWTSYLGIVGTLTGIAGSIMGYISLKRSAQIKALDLRIELKRAEANVRSKHQSLRQLMNQANASRRKVASAKGLFSSSFMDKWNAELEADGKACEQLKTELANEPTDYDCLSSKELESKLIACHKTELKIQSLLDKYQASIANDSEQARQLQQDKQRDFERRFRENR